MRSRSGVAQAASAITRGSIGVDSRFLGNTSAGDGCGQGRVVVLGGSGALEVLNSGRRDGFAFCKVLAFSVLSPTIRERL